MKKLGIVTLMFIFVTALGMAQTWSTGAASQSTSNATSNYTINVSYKTGIGNYLVDANGMTLYYLDGESTSTIKCNGMCLSFWPAFNVKSIVVPSGLNSSNFQIFKRPDGSSQLSYEGKPLYYFIRDSYRGDVSGNNLKDPFGIWYAVTF
ncbi:COG4315 family predicted lipoprotein [Athalassotoga sp.]|uniref:COG4315 family predicted lipoprotein n=1 Tax=Athalassotoga sp. TaxID=2022597 RepID=UPI003D0105BA